MSNEPTLLDRVEQAITAVIYAPKIDNTQSIARRMAKVALRLTDTELASLRARVEALQLDNDRLAGESGANLARAEQRAKRLEVKDVRIAELEARVEELERAVDRSHELLSAASMLLEPADFKDAENATSALFVRQQIDEFLPKGMLR